MNHPVHTLVVGVVATLVMDLWGLFRKPLLGWSAPDYRLAGRWVAHLARARFRHQAIARSPAMRGEALVGWASHYLLGVVFAAALLAVMGMTWIADPTWLPPLAFGLVTVAVPTLVMQPAMGMGMALRLQSVVTHAVFGLGLYLGAQVARVVV